MAANIDSGMPFDSQENREQRRRQREVVRQLRRRHVEEVCGELVRPPAEVSGHAERWLRGQADLLLEQHHDLFERFRVEQTAVQVLSLLASAAPPATAHARFARQDTMEAVPRGDHVEWTDEEGGVMLHLIELLTWADDIANDGYTTRPPASTSR